MSTATFNISATRTISANWIINQGEDLTWFIGSGLIGYFAIALMAAGFPVAPLYIIWMFGVDGPHVLATVTRTYCDKNERAKLGPWLWILAPFLVVGPIAAGILGEALGSTGAAVSLLGVVPFIGLPIVWTLPETNAIALAVGESPADTRGSTNGLS